jgi:uncharacterized protein (DUF1697 family)
MKETKTENLIAYVAFLRGINVGGRIIKMDALKKALASIGLRDLKTIGASGNVLFATPETDVVAIVKQMEACLLKNFNAAISVMVRTLAELRALVASDPFRGVAIAPETRLYITFFSAPTKSKSGLSFPFELPDKSLRILKVTKTEIRSVVTLSANAGTIEAMELIEKEFGKGVTTRNWNTIKKLTA